ncbi:antitoxin PrlF [Mesorhizobium albiziae]|uniref:Antitoxin PrlF n=1 Tax=Neomesorhizobium albiziae TaxID=335020 RepID=A0A1I3VJ59_9HYPH|nr:type II toxin-antitoxin system PrlF family antitoxin [Mesorhizobium albiziae]GLS28957.1 AbrB family transcriptional regulator [Mesorhizobium albiziae]SFJ95202.1 antitoxin PrlF [Mesorhizobium albiziae]
MTTILEEISTITAKGQTTVPKAVRQALGVDTGDRIAFRVDEHGVSVHRATGDDEDPAIERFLAFLAEDIERRPEAVNALTPQLAERIAALTKGVDVSADQPIHGDVDL